MTAWTQRAARPYTAPTTTPDTVLGSRLIVPACVLALLAGLVAGKLATGTHPVLALLLPLLLLPLLLWNRPAAGVLLLVAAAVTVEQFDYEVGPRGGAVTASIPFFHSVSVGSGITPAELFLGLFLVIWVLTQVQKREPLLRRTSLSDQLVVFLGLVALYFVIGLSRHGNFTAALWEIRPFFYLGVAYVVAASLITTRALVRGVMWIMVLGSAVKGAYGIVIWLSVRNVQPRPEAVLAHEESFFFGLVVVLTLALWIFQVPGRLRTVATCVMPIVLLADMVNSRRTAWAILGLSTVTLLVIAYVRRPDRRPVLRRLGLAMLVILAAYLPAFWNKDGTLAQPARAVRSAVAPDARDEASNQYRYVENANLSINIQQTHSTGTGFGVPINYVIGMVDLRSSVKSLTYVPHNGVLYIWMRLGLLGEIVFWLFVLKALVSAARLTRHPDGETAVLAALTASAVVAYVVMGDKDMGFVWFRIAFMMGVLLGAVEARARLWKSEGTVAEVPQPRAVPVEPTPLTLWSAR